jgi:integrase
MKKRGIPGVKRYFERKTRKWYTYHRKSGKRLRQEYGTPEFIIELARIEAERTAGLSGVIPDTLGALIVAYKGSSAFTTLAPRSQSDYHKVIDYLKPLQHLPLAEITSSRMVKIREKAFQKHKRRFANYLIAVMSKMFEVGRELDIVERNPVKGIVTRIRRPKSAPQANRPWEMSEVWAVLDEAPLGLKVPLALALLVGLREGDAIRITWKHFDGSRIAVATSKSGKPIWWPCPKPLIATLNNAPRSKQHSEIALNSRSQPWTNAGLRASWRKFRMGLEKEGKIQPGLTIHGARHTVATILRGEGIHVRAIADALGQKTTKMAEHYSKHADLMKSMEAVSEAFEAALSASRNAEGTSNV